MHTSWSMKSFYIAGPRCVALGLTIIAICHAWTPDSSTKMVNAISKTLTTKFESKSRIPEHFVVLYQDHDSILLGGRNAVYNLSVSDFTERRDMKLEWNSTDAHMEICQLKGKREEDCQNYIRILAPLSENQLLVCGTNSYKPMCRYYTVEPNGNYALDKEVNGIGKCPYDPENNSTAVFNNGQLYSATVADFSGGDPLIYREPQRTELSDLKQLNGPNFVTSIPDGDYIFFFYRETAVEYINCGKVIYSRVARVCKDDKGGPHQFRDKWTSFLKARLNCSVPGDYPFYFDEIQSTSDIVEGTYGGRENRIIYGTLTTPTNAIGGSAICAYSMADILAAFRGTFKHQESMNSNWLPLPEDKIPDGNPGKCVQDSRVLPENIVNFVKSHSLMENAVPSYFGKPILIRVSQEYRFTAIAVDPQVPTINNGKFDVLYVGTNDGRVLKVVNIVSANSTKAVVISENAILAKNSPVKQLKIVPGSGKVVVVGIEEVRLATLNHCGNMHTCNDCVALQDPHCAWDYLHGSCVTVDNATLLSTAFVQDVVDGNVQMCRMPQGKRKVFAPNNEITKNGINVDDVEDEIANTISDNNTKDCDGGEDSNEIRTGCAIQQAQIDCAKKWQNIGIIASLLCLVIGFISGFCMSKKCQHHPQYPSSTPFIEQHNHLDRSTPKATKSVNLNVSPNPPPPKKDNLDISKDLNILDHDTGTLQKVKKTYI